jgi:hypothetical protein
MLYGLTFGLVLQVLVAAWFALVQVKIGAKGLSLAGPQRSGETSRLGSRDPVADGIKCELPAWCKKSKTKLWTWSWCIGGGQVKE